MQGFEDIRYTWCCKVACFRVAAWLVLGQLTKPSVQSLATKANGRYCPFPRARGHETPSTPPSLLIYPVLPHSALPVPHPSSLPPPLRPSLSPSVRACWLTGMFAVRATTQISPVCLFCGLNLWSACLKFTIFVELLRRRSRCS